MKNLLLRFLSLGLVAALGFTATPVFASRSRFVPRFNTISEVALTVPANGDVNPYGVAIVQKTTGKLVKGDILVSNFNNKDNLQGTGTTIVEISPGGHVSLFAQLDAAKLPGPCPGGVGLTTALVVLREGWVIVGSLPTTDGMAATAKAGCLIVLNPSGTPVETISGQLVDGPWDMTAFERDDRAVLFVTNVLDGTVAASPNVVKNGFIARITLRLDDNDPPMVIARAMIASGFMQRTDPNALVIGPTGLGLGKNGTLYVADSLDDRVAAISRALTRRTSAGIGRTISKGGALKTPLGLAIAPDGDILTVNGGDGNLVELTPKGKQVDVKMVDVTATGAGTLFGLAVTDNKGIYFVNDGNNKLYLLH